MPDTTPPKKRISLRLIFLSLILAALVFFLVLLISPLAINPINQVREQARKAEARTSAWTLTAALKGYYVQYGGKWPDFTGDGLFLDEKRQGQLLRVLRGKDPANNRSMIAFIEAKTAGRDSDSDHPYRSGISPETSAFFDPWGNPYRIAIDADDDEQIANPYSDDGPPIRARVIVWSLGKDGKQGSPANPHTSKGSDDVTSWQ